MISRADRELVVFSLDLGLLFLFVLCLICPNREKICLAVLFYL